MRFRVNRIAPVLAAVLLGGCLGSDGGGAGAAPRPAHGPASDYPVVLGEAFTIGDVTYEPADKLNHDEIGRTAISPGSAAGVNAAHKTLPLPSYAEVTSLESGRTILVRIERRGPMRNDRLIELSRMAAAQLEITDGTPVRVRRVNPPEPERALLRTGQEAPARMDTPGPLLAVLMRKLQGQDAAAGTPAMPVNAAAPEVLQPAPQPPEMPAAATQAGDRLEAAAKGSHYVQVAAFSARERAAAAASAIGGYVASERGLWHLRLGPYESAAGADTGLAEARSAGYSDARIRRAD